MRQPIKPPQFIIYSYGYNCDKLLERHFASLKAQTFQRWTQLVVYDSPTDKTESLIEEHKPKNTIVNYNQSQVGWLTSFYNHVSENYLTQNYIIVFFDLWDKLPPNALETLYEIYQYENPLVTHSHFTFIDGRLDNVPTRIVGGYAKGTQKRANYRSGLFKFYGLRSTYGQLINKIEKDSLYYKDKSFPLERYELPFFTSLLEKTPLDRLYYSPKWLYMRGIENPESVILSTKELPQNLKDIDHFFRSYKRLTTRQVEAPSVVPGKRSPIWNHIQPTVPCSLGQPATITQVHDKLVTCFPSIESTILDSILTSQKPKVAIAMVSWLRPDKLITNLKNTLEVCPIPLHMCIRIQGSEQLKSEERTEIERLAAQFYSHELRFTPGNVGFGVSQHDIVHVALDTGDAEYILTLDDDTYFPVGGIEILAAVLESDPEVGVSHLWCSPHFTYFKLVRDPQGLSKIEAQNSKLGFTYADAVGSATHMIRRDVFSTCDLDYNYFQGCCDFDFCMQVKKANFNIVHIAHPDVVPTNDKGGCSEYKKGRRNKPAITKGAQRFIQKWDVQIEY